MKSVASRERSAANPEKGVEMNQLSIRRFGLALGAAFALTYLGCALVMATVNREMAIRFFNSIMHGVDVEPDYALGHALVGNGDRCDRGVHTRLAFRRGRRVLLQP